MAAVKNPESRLETLVQAIQPENRAKWARQWKKQGKRVFGLLCPYVPEEIVYAAGVLPWHVAGTWREGTPRALYYRPMWSCKFCTHVLESYLSGEMDFLDGVVSTNFDDDVRRLWDIFAHLDGSHFVYQLYLPYKASELSIQRWIRSVAEFKRAFEEFIGAEITEEDLRHAVEVYNTQRLLLRSHIRWRETEDERFGTKPFGYSATIKS